MIKMATKYMDRFHPEGLLIWSEFIKTNFSETEEGLYFSIW